LYGLMVCNQLVLALLHLFPTVGQVKLTPKNRYIICEASFQVESVVPVGRLRFCIFVSLDGEMVW
jgi:hypothetical protein